MKNTMKIKSLLSFFVPAAMMSLMVASCSDYDNGYTEKAIKFTEDFRKAYGDIDPEQDWNLAERGTVTVSTQKESEVKIYVFSGGDYYLVGDYQGVKNTQVLGFDMVEGTSSILVTDGETAQKTVPGGVVAFGSTRTTYGGNGVVTIDKIENDKGLYLETTGKTYPKYVEFNSMDDYSKIFKTVPEIGWKETRNKTNLNKVPSNFHYTSNGSFIIYPIFWDTSSLNTLGVYYRNGDQIVKVPVYKHKEGNEVQYATANTRKDADWSNHYETNGHFDNDTKILSWTASNYNQVGDLGFDGNLISQGYKYLTINAEMLESTTQYRIYFRDKNNSGNQKIYSVDKSGSYTIDLSDVPNDIVTNCTILISGGENSQTGSVKVNSMYLWSDDVTWHNFEGTDDTHWHCSDIFEQGDKKFNGVKMRAQGIKVDIPEGTVFGMYLEKTENAGTENAKTYTFYSESELNDPAEVGYGVTDDDHGNVIQVTDPNNPKSHPCYASAFDVDGLHYLGFEDWPNAPYNNSDFDLNDMIFAFDGCKPTVIVEEPDKAEWLLVCEDLGGSFDTDYNDVVFKVEHVSGREYANVTAMAAGGTLASYICFCDPTQGADSHDDIVIGEIHQMFDAAREESGAYTPINAYSRFDKTGHSVTIPVDKNWQIAYNVDADQYTAAALNETGDAKGANMGGFYVLTLPAGTPVPSNPTIGNLGNNASRIAAPGPGAAPYIICLPYTYEVEEGENINKYVWAWPQELCTICSATYENGKYKGTNGGAYSEFAYWVGDYTTHKDWYKHKTNDMTVEQWLVSSKNKNNGQVKQPSNLNNIGPWTVGSGNQINLEDNLVNFSLGALHYEFNGNSVSGSAFQVPTQPGTYTVNVTQEADQDYLAGSTTITLIVPRKVAEYKFTVKTTNNSNTNNGLNTNLALAVVDGALKLKTTADNDNQTWIAEDAGDGKVYLRNKGTNQYLGCNGEYSWTATFSINPVANKKGRFTIQDLSGGKTIMVERNGDRGLKAETIADGKTVDLNARWNTASDNYIIWGTSGQQQTSPLGNNGNKTIIVDEVINLRANLTNVTEGTLKYYLTVPNVVSNWEINNPTTFAPDKAGEHRIHVVLTKSNGTQETTDFTVTVNPKNNGGGDSSSTKTYDFPGSYESDINMTIEKSGDTYNVKYNGNPIMSGITSLTVHWTSTGNFWLYSSKYTYQSTQYQSGGSGDITLSSSDLSNLVSNSETLVASYNNYGRITVSLTGN